LEGNDAVLGRIGLRGTNPGGRWLSGRIMALPSLAGCTPATAPASSETYWNGMMLPASSGARRTLFTVLSVEGFDAGFDLRRQGIGQHESCREICRELTGGSIWIGMLDADVERVKRVFSHAMAERGRAGVVSSGGCWSCGDGTYGGCDPDCCGASVR
jgi:hypothetical protein